MSDIIEITNEKDSFCRVDKLKVMYKFFCNSNYMYCQNLDTKEITERKIKYYELPKKNNGKHN